MSDGSASREVVRPTLHRYGLTTGNLEVMLDASPEFAARPIGTDVDPGAMAAARASGISVEELHRRANAGEFPPSKPMDPGVLI